MATLINNSSGNLTSSTAWSVVDSTAYTNVLATQETGTTASTVAFVSSTSTTPGAITIDGIALKINATSASPTGTFSIRLFNATGAAAVAGTTVTVNVSDMNNGIHWAFFKFSAPVTLLAATLYNVQILTSTAGQVTPYRKSATAGDWTYALRTTTVQAPTAGDQLLIMGDFISAGVNNTYTITMDNTAATAYGPATTGVATVEINNKAIFTYGIAASTAYQFRSAGSVYINQGATFNIGTSGTPIPSTSSATLEFIVTVNVQFGLQMRGNGIFSSYGATKTGRAFLTADAAATATALTSDVSTGWLANDSIVIAATNRTVAETELKTLSVNASGTSLTLSTGLGFAHSGTSPTKGELANLTRNVKIFGQSIALQTYINITTNNTVTFGYTELFFMGSATATNRGVDIGTTTGSFSMVGCALRNFEVASSVGLNLNAVANANITISDCVLYRISNVNVNTAASTANTVTINNVWCFSGVAAASMFNIAAIAGTFTNLVAVSSLAIGIAVVATGVITATYGNFTAHANTTVGVNIQVLHQTNSMLVISNLTTWRNLTRGVLFTTSSGTVLDTITSFGNTSNGFEYSSCFGCMVRNATVNAGVTLTQPIGVTLSGSNADCYVDNSTFGGTTTHATSDVSVGTANTYHQVVFRNCLMASTTEVSTQTNLIFDAYIGSSRHDQTVGVQKMWKRTGTITLDTTFFVGQSPSQRLTPNTANQKLLTQEKKVAVPTGRTAKITVYVRKSVAGDGVAYNGNQPNLLLEADPASGIASDTILATSTAAGNGAFEVLTGTTAAVTDNTVLRFVVQCDGTAGWINVDRWNVEII